MLKECKGATHYELNIMSLQIVKNMHSVSTGDINTVYGLVFLDKMYVCNILLMCTGWLSLRIFYVIRLF